MEVLHISAECYPIAKVGGLADVVGALPKYLNQAGIDTSVIIPKYSNKWINTHQFREVFRGNVRLDNVYVPYAIEEYTGNDLGYRLYVSNIPGLFDRPGVYGDPVSGRGYGDEVERYLCFQQSVIHWVLQFQKRPPILHCHDYHTGLIPFMIKYCPEYRWLSGVPTVFTIHNGAYHGMFSWRNINMMPYFDTNASGMIEWNGLINPLASGIKNSWRVTTVSPSYMEELKEDSNGLEWLFREEARKSEGIINGIDADVWDPATDPMIYHRMETDVEAYKNQNKAVLAQRFNINPDLPLITYIGRLANEKGADLLPDLITSFLYSGQRASFVVLGSGDPSIGDQFLRMKYQFAGVFDVALEYNEALSHQLYAGSDFLIMPSRVEPCGLNQMYAHRYGTVPIVRSVGGLRDTVTDIGETNGNGIKFNHFSVEDAMIALHRATIVYRHDESMKILRRRVMALDRSWETSANTYINMYKRLNWTV